MSNIIEEAKGLEALLAAAEKMNEEKKVERQSCNLDDEECLSCGA